ncbi:HTH-type transcriptional regulator EutR [Entomohabitans teleogrylli]|uniref:HTH-type transcriptional regulator EutR n=1 Tax=Entomohabitans teleogrylli TaxID=1384589 RepID=UPI00073D614F|nr:HTH-type transcriptional regulator EutR [Entomohabitans teleogrylli]
MRKKIAANLHHLYRETLPEDVRLSPLAEDENVHQRQTRDVYEHACTITAWQQLYDQLQPGEFRGELTEILLDEIQVFREYTSLALRQSCMVWPNAWWFGVPAVRSAPRGYIGAQELGREEIATRPGGHEFELSTPDDYTILGVVISDETLFEHAGVFHRPERLRLLLECYPALDVPAAKKEALWQFVHQALATFSNQPDSLQQTNVRKVLSHNLLVAMSELLENAHPVMSPESAHLHSYRRLVSRARERVLEQMSEPVTVLDLCRELHVSRRTLQNAFHTLLGIGPNMWLKRIRLNAVRRELISPWSPFHTVKDAALQWGFWHLGQFATDYQRLFNEKPSATLSGRLRMVG